MKSVMEVYAEVAKKNPPWTPEEESDFIRKWWKKDRDYFVSEAMKHNLNLVFNLINKHSFKKTDEDVFQRAVIALTESLREFDPKKGVRIFTWAFKKVYWAILQTKTTNISSISEELSYRANRSGKHLVAVSMEMPVGGNSDGDVCTIGERIHSENVAAGYEIPRSLSGSIEVNGTEIQTSVHAAMKDIFKILTRQEVVVIRGLLAGRNQVQIGVEMKLSRMRISQLAASAFTKIRSSKYASNLKELLG